MARQMEEPTGPTISILIVTFNSRHQISSCLESVRRQTETSTEIIVFDNNSTDGTCAVIAAGYPDVKLVASDKNIGFAAANNAAAKLATGEFLAFVNPDVVVDVGWLSPLIRALASDHSVGAATSQILLMDSPETINAFGNEIHLSGITTCRDIGKPELREHFVENVGAMSGAAFAMKKSVFSRIGGFEDSFFMYFEDTDLSLRLRQQQLRCIAVSSSRAYHNHSSEFGHQKLFFLERNRYLSLLSLMSAGALAIMMPSLLLSEVASWSYCALRGQAALRAKAAAWKEVARRWQELRRKRFAEGSERISVRALPEIFSPKLRAQYVSADAGPILNVLQFVAWLTAAPLLKLVRIARAT